MGPLTTVSGFIPSTHLQAWLNRVCWGYNYLITRGGPFLYLESIVYHAFRQLWLVLGVSSWWTSTLQLVFQVKANEFWLLKSRFSQLFHCFHAICIYRLYLVFSFVFCCKPFALTLKQFMINLDLRGIGVIRKKIQIFGFLTSRDRTFPEK